MIRKIVPPIIRAKNESWIRHPVSEVQCAARHNCEEKLGINYNNLVLAVPMREGAGNRIIDYSKYANPGSNDGAIWQGNDLHFITNDTITVPEISAYDIITPTLTIAAEIRMDALGASWVGLVAKFNAVGAGGSGYGYGLFKHDSTHDITFITASTQDGGYADAGADSNPVVGQWYHVVGTFDGTTMKLYIDGVQQADTGIQASIYNNSEPITIGSYETFHLNGAIRNVNILDVNLTSRQVELLANNPGLLCEPVARPVLSYQASGPDVGIVADPLDVAVTQHGDFIAGVTIAADPIVVTVTQHGVRSQWPANDRDPALDQEFDCSYTDVHGRRDAGIPVITVDLTGAWLNQTIFADPIVVTVSQEGGWVTAILVDADPIIVTIGLKSADIVTELFKTNWLKWSNIGSLDFTIDKTNVAGERPLDWRGWIYSIRKLGSKVVVYGENGVSLLLPSDKYYGLQTIYRVGLKGKGAVSGDDSVHYFVDNLGQLWQFSEGLEKLDYSEYLSGMLDNLVLSWDVANKLLYICDGSQGYVYSQDSKSLGAGPVNVTGIDSQSGTLYVASPATIATPTFEICTDIYDLGSRRGKNIYSLEIGTDLTEALEAAIDYRIDKADGFAVTDWHVVDPRGIVFIPVHGREFRFKVKCDTLEYFEVDSITVTGEVCRH